MSLSLAMDTFTLNAPQSRRDRLTSHAQPSGSALLDSGGPHAHGDREVHAVAGLPDVVMGDPRRCRQPLVRQRETRYGDRGVETPRVVEVPRFAEMPTSAV